MLGRVRRVRCRVLRLVSAELSAASFGRDGALMALLEGSMCRGRRVNVWSMMSREVGNSVVDGDRGRRKDFERAGLCAGLWR